MSNFEFYIVFPTSAFDSAQRGSRLAGISANSNPKLILILTLKQKKSFRENEMT